MIKEIQSMQRKTMIRLFLSVLVDVVVYFVAALCGLACLLAGYNIAGIAILGLIAVKGMLAVAANRQNNQIQEVMNSILKMTEELVPNQ